jgi:hypothetical protein
MRIILRSAFAAAAACGVLLAPAGAQSQAPAAPKPAAAAPAAPAGAAAKVPETLDQAQARAALQRGVDWLLANQDEEGAWGRGVCDSLLEYGFSIETYYNWQVAGQALACMALMRVEETPEVRAALEAGLKRLSASRDSKRGSEWDSDFLWAGLYGTVAFAQAAKDPRFQGDDWRALVEEGGRRYLAILVRNQTPEGGWGYYDFPYASERPKWATSFCTALVLPALQDAIALGWLDDPSVLARAHKYVARCAAPNGSFEYDLNMIPRVTGGENINDFKGSLGRIQVCNWGLASTGEKKITPDRIREGLERFFDEHRFLDCARMRPIPHEAYYQNAAYFYWFGHYYAAEAINLLPEGEREALHARLRPHAVKVQRADGSTADFLPYTSMTTASTAYLVLTLALGLPASST